MKGKYFLTSILLILFYRRGMEPFLFVNYYKRDIIGNVFDIERLKRIFILVFKLFSRDIIATIYRSVIAIKFYSLLDYVYFIFSSLLIFLLIYKAKLEYKVKKFLIIGGLGSVFSLVIFVFSSYIPNMFGFENRNLGALRLFFSILLIGLIMLCTTRLSYKFQKPILLFIFLLFNICSISIKNAWVYASYFNDKLFSDIFKEAGSCKECTMVIDYDIYNIIKSDPHLILREPIFYNSFESDFLILKQRKNPQKIKVYNIESKIPQSIPSPIIKIKKIIT
ncbi:hypothetical protein [Chryseobacterium nematophagum]|nr:hypothetical protein [Chryseobacterium nematophagum]